MKKVVEELADLIGHRLADLSGIKITIDSPESEKGHWFVDVSVGDLLASIECTPEEDGPSFYADVWRKEGEPAFGQTQAEKQTESPAEVVDFVNRRIRELLSS